MSDLITNLEDKVSLNKYTISYIDQEIPKIQENILLFNPTVTKIDVDTNNIISEINNLRRQIVSISTAANAVGCGTIVGIKTVYTDNVQIRYPYYSDSSYDGLEPYTDTTLLLSLSTIGIGSFVAHIPEDTSQPGVGSVFGGIGSCFRLSPPCNSADCINYKNSITEIENQIISLQTKILNLTKKSNAIRSQRSEYEIARYGQNRAKRTLNEKNSEISLAIEYIKDTSPSTP